MIKWKRILGITLLSALVLGACGREEAQLTDPENPVTLSVWHYYNGSQQEIFDSLVNEFNATVGKEKGIYVQETSKGSINELESAVRDATDQKIGADEIPDIFSTYSDTAYDIGQKGKLANLSEYMTEEELGQYVESYIEEGRIARDGGLYIFPVAKSTEVMMFNKTDWNKFAEETDASLDDLATLEGIVKVAEAYYNWTDAKTPDTPNDGKAFYGRDSMSNYFIIGMRQQGVEIFEVSDGGVTIHDDKEKIRRLWDNYYVPYIKGYFASFGSFRSDDVRTGDLIAYTGSTSSAMYFPDKVETEEGSYKITCEVKEAPVLEGGIKYAVQQGAGMAVMKTEQVREYAAVEFLKWLTRAENNLRFGCESGYLPVRKEANSKEKLDEVIRDQNLRVAGKTYDCLVKALGAGKDTELYSAKSFPGAFDARKVLDYSLSDKAVKDRGKVVAKLKKGKSLEEACEPYLTEEAYDAWYQEFDQALRKGTGKSESGE